MMRMNFLGVLLCILLLAAATQTFAQGKVVYVRASDVTKEKLVELLKPPGGETMAAMGKTVNCAPYRKELKEGTLKTANRPQAGLEVLFTFDSAKLGSNARSVLNTLAQALNSKELAAYCFEIQGHTDNVGKPAYNMKLSARRAASVAGYLSSKGKVAKGRLIAVGLGPKMPIADNSTDVGRARNRRVQVLNLGSGQ